MRRLNGDRSQSVQVSAKPTFRHIKLEEVGITSHQGEIAATRRNLEEIFGPPTFDEPSGTSLVSSTVEWDLQFSDGTVATIYDTDIIDDVTAGIITPGADELYEWHIGGRGPDAVARILSVLRQDQ